MASNSKITPITNSVTPNPLLIIYIRCDWLRVFIRIINNPNPYQNTIVPVINPIKNVPISRGLPIDEPIPNAKNKAPNEKTSVGFKIFNKVIETIFFNGF